MAWSGLAGCGRVWLGTAWRGEAWLGKARQGKDERKAGSVTPEWALWVLLVFCGLAIGRGLWLCVQAFLEVTD